LSGETPEMWLKLEQRDFLKWLLLRGHVEVSDTDTCGSSGLGPSFGKPNPKGAVSPPACSSARFQEIDSIEIKGARISLNGQPEDFLIIDLKAAARRCGRVCRNVAQPPSPRRLRVLAKKASHPIVAVEKRHRTRIALAW
jgi:hypothetical protein